MRSPRIRGAGQGWGASLASSDATHLLHNTLVVKALAQGSEILQFCTWERTRTWDSGSETKTVAQGWGQSAGQQEPWIPVPIPRTVCALYASHWIKENRNNPGWWGWMLGLPPPREMSYYWVTNSLSLSLALLQPQDLHAWFLSDLASTAGIESLTVYRTLLDGGKCGHESSQAENLQSRPPICWVSALSTMLLRPGGWHHCHLQ